ncbi:MAG: zeta toxin family protein [Armatimonadetes bacterium]|nr:zeta toxin family protein [Armatimonadota bacterium]
MRTKIRDQLYGVGAVSRGKVALIIIGPPASGKSSLATPLATKHNALIIDSDMAKPWLPEYEAGIYASAVHQESAQIASMVFEKAIDVGDNVVYVAVGKSLPNLRELVSLLKELDYKVELHLVDADPEVCADRAVKRLHSEGRFVDPAYVLYEVGTRPRNNLEILLDENCCDEFEKHTN